MAHFPWQQQFHALRAEQEAAAFSRIVLVSMSYCRMRERERERESTCRHPHRPQIPSVTSSSTSPLQNSAAHHSITTASHIQAPLTTSAVFSPGLLLLFLSYLSYQVFCDRSLWAEPISWLFSFYPSNHDSQRTVGLGQWLRIAVSVSWALRAAFYSQSVLFLFSPRFQVRRDSRSLRDLKNVASAEVWLVSENNSLWR